MKISHQQGDPRTLTLLAENARFMPHEMFQRLVDNLRRDGVLTQWPFVWHNQETGERIVLSGNHRVDAAIQAGLTSIDWTECDEPMSKDERLGYQLSHNAISGEDDPTVLKRLYESIEDVDARLFSGLSDNALDLMGDVDMSSLAEANLDFTTVQIVFLPPEYERALAAVDLARKMSADVTWIAVESQHYKVLDAIEDARESAHVINVATALDVLLDVWDRHREDLRSGWLGDDGHVLGGAKDDVPITSIAGHVMPAAQGAFVVRAIEKMKNRGEIKDSWEAIEHWAGMYLDETPPSKAVPEKPVKKAAAKKAVAKP